MKSIRTIIHKTYTVFFEEFLAEHGMSDISVGSYDKFYNILNKEELICYLHKDSNMDANATMTYLILKHGSIEKAFSAFMRRFDPVEST